MTWLLCIYEVFDCEHLNCIMCHIILTLKRALLSTHCPPIFNSLTPEKNG
uniref:Uncharacterized protein n=1 Tax=Lepeophtheirus salmonis TaxID=72036 RepID=A0A0K2UT72_LEPSM